MRTTAYSVCSLLIAIHDADIDQTSVLGRIARTAKYAYIAVGDEAVFYQREPLPGRAHCARGGAYFNCRSSSTRTRGDDGSWENRARVLALDV